MPSVSRRGFLRWTSVGIAATGVIGALAPVGALAAGPQAQPAAPTTPMAPMPATPSMPLMAGGEPFVVYVSDPATGAGSILVGERSIPFTNAAIVQTLLSSQAIG